MGRDDREGSLGNLEEQPGNSQGRSEIDDTHCPFFVDSCGVSTQELALYSSMESIIYDRPNVAVLGTKSEAEDAKGMDK